MQPISFRPAPCAGTLPRRAFLRTGLTGLSTLGLADLFRLQARAGAGHPAGGPSMIVVWLWGGPSHLETFDPKPEAPAEYREAQGAIATNVPGIRITDRLPLLARVADKYCLIRSIAHDSPQHVGAIHTTITGYPGELIETPPFKPKYPDLFTVAHKVLPTRRPGLPQYIGIPRLRCIGGAYLGPSYDPFSVAADSNDPTFSLPTIS